MKKLIFVLNGTEIHKKVYQIVALRDIPNKNVKAGDLGGFISDKKVLSQEGDCWIGQGGMAYGGVSIRGDAYLKNGLVIACINNVHAFYEKKKYNNRYIEINDNAVIDGTNVFIRRFLRGETVIKNKAFIGGSANLVDVTSVKDEAHISDNASLEKDSVVVHKSHISGNATIGVNARIYGESNITDFAEVRKDSTIESSTISGYTVVPENRNVSHSSPIASLSNYTPADNVVKEVPNVAEDSSQKSMAISVFEEIESQIQSYQHDIIKLIKFPLMNDLTNSHALAMNIAYKKALRAKDIAEESLFCSLVDELEEKFMVTESHARKISLSQFDKEEKGKIVKAQDLLNIVINDAAAPQEKKSAYKQVCRNLEGLIAIPPLAVKSLAERSGILEIEM